MKLSKIFFPPLPFVVLRDLKFVEHNYLRSCTGDVIVGIPDVQEVHRAWTDLLRLPVMEPILRRV